MKKTLGIALFTLSIWGSVSGAQTPAEITITVTPAELGVIGNSLYAMPFKDVSPLIQKLEAQVKKQATPAAEPAAAPEAKPDAKGK